MIFLTSHNNGTTDTKALQSIRCEVSDEILSTFPHEREREREREEHPGLAVAEAEGDLYSIQ